MQEDRAARVWDDAHLGISPPPPWDVSLQGRLDPALLPPTVVSKLAGSGTGVWKDAAPPQATCKAKDGPFTYWAVVSLKTHFRI